MTSERLGRYRLQDELGRGAMGTVYRAVDPALERDVAVKVISMRESGVLDPHEAEARFLRESRLAARLVHPNVVTVFDAGREGDRLYLVMELVEGQSLAELMASGRFPDPAAALDLTAQVADALAAAHEMGVVHRDIKPANILITATGRAKVSDFGVARAIGDGTTLTRTGMVVGSPAYISPEQLRGEATDGRSDLFSLGVVLFELMLRRRPFPADTVTTLIYQILNDDPLADPEVSRSLDEPLRAFLAMALAKIPGERPADAADFASRLRELAATRSGVLDGVTRSSDVNTASASSGAAVEETAPTVIAPIAVEESPPASVSAIPVAETDRVPPVGVLVGGSAVVLALVVTAVFLLGRRAQAPVALGPMPTPASVATTPAARTPVLAGEGVRAAPAPESGASVVATARSSGEADRSPAAVTLRQESAAPQLVPATSALSPASTIRPSPRPTPPPPVVATFECKSGAEFNVSPEEAEVSVGDTLIGIADDWDGMGGGEVYVFPGPGTYYVRLALDGYQTVWVMVIVSEAADEDVADIDTELEKVNEED